MSPGWVAVGNLDLTEVRKFLGVARGLMKTDPQSAMKKTLVLVSDYLECQGIEPELLGPLQVLAIGLGDLQIGNQPDFLKPNRDGPRLKSIPDAAQKAIAAAAITLASRGDFRREVTLKGAKRLGVKEAVLINFRKALMARRIKSPTANHVYDWCIGNCPEDEDRRIVINYLLSLIDKQEV